MYVYIQCKELNCLLVKMFFSSSDLKSINIKMVATINHILVFKFTANTVHSMLVKGSCSIGTVVDETKESPSFQSFLI